ncbi:NAD(P)/FAD-dependent oxidoreductase [Clostridium sp. YIM B02505]|uniref:NAD(P)/FAD-dependent oxidoreductase n=1 Tax=Clostridium yunnanense TaxID=2800325 RepID=A0ABS1EVQ4_9CLOT|nr:FAD-dependent oxidoreductase [Clostridium yunnanense]MBK1813380.1 NAD(P)/FAD-dependent oxidoreductase [Clostridium yunnanense]
MKHVIIGASAAGINAAKTLRDIDPKCEIVVISKDVNVYSRCMLHHYISGDRDLNTLSFVESDFFEANKITWLKGLEVKNIKADKKMLVLSNWDTISYDTLLIASGASASIPPIKNLREANNVYPLRNIEDAVGISKNCKAQDNVVIIGAGLVGIDAAVGLIKKKVNIHLVEMADRILPLQLDKEASLRYEKLLEAKNVTLHLSASAKEVVINDNGEATGVVLNDNELIPCSLIVVAAGVKPNIDFLGDSGVRCERGILIDKYCKTNVQDIYAAGDVTALSPIWPVAVRQGKSAALNMAGIETICEDNFAYLNSMNFLGLQAASIGIANAPDDSYIVDIFKTDKVYKKIIQKDGLIHGALLVGEISYCGVMTHLIKNKINISKINKSVFDLTFADFYGIKENGEYMYNI